MRVSLLNRVEFRGLLLNGARRSGAAVRRVERPSDGAGFTVWPMHRRPLLAVALAGTVVAALAGCSRPAPVTQPVVGMVALRGAPAFVDTVHPSDPVPGDACTAAKAYGDVAKGAAIHVLDSNGGRVAATEIGSGFVGADGSTCAFPWAIAHVPVDRSSYRVQIGGHEAVRFTRTAFFAGTTLTLG